MSPVYFRSARAWRDRDRLSRSEQRKFDRRPCFPLKIEPKIVLAASDGGRNIALFADAGHYCPTAAQ